MSRRTRAHPWESLVFAGLLSGQPPLRITGPALVAAVLFTGPGAVQLRFHDLEYAPASAVTLLMPRLILGPINTPLLDNAPIKFRRGVVVEFIIGGTAEMSVVFRPLTRAETER